MIANCGAGKLEHFLAAAVDGHADILAAASVFHFDEISIPELKACLKEQASASWSEGRC